MFLRNNNRPVRAMSLRLVWTYFKLGTYYRPRKGRNNRRLYRFMRNFLSVAEENPHGFSAMGRL